MEGREIFDLVRKNYAESNKVYLTQQAESACKHCSNNPQNGGSGICNCILGSPKIT